MVKFEESSPDKQPGLLRSQWYKDAGVGRGVDPEVAAELGYKDPSDLAGLGAAVRRVVEGSAQEEDTPKKIEAPRGRPTKPYRARYKDTTDNVTKQLRDVDAH
jgi:hypothetical protein